MAWYNDIFNFNKPQPQKANIRKTIDFEQQLQRVRQDATKYNIALQAAESPMYPNRFLLMQTYQQIVLDGQVQSAMLQRKSKVLCKRFMVCGPDGEMDETKTAYFNQKWFYDFQNLALDSIFWGFSCVQFGAIVNDRYTSVDLIPRIYVVPEFSLVRTNTATVTEGKRFDEAPYNNWCIGVGEKKDLGLMMYLAPYVIWKKNAMAAWAEFAEVFGSPIRVGKTDVRDEMTRKNMENMLRNMGVASWAVLDLNDNIELMQASRTDAYAVFDKMVERCNSEISKIILGQTGTTDEKSYSGSANVHEGVAAMIAKQDTLKMQFIIEDQLVPMMIRNGFDLTGCTFKYDESESLPLAEQAKIDVDFLKAGIKLEHEYLEHKYGVEIMDEPGMEEEEEEEEEDTMPKEVIEVENKLRNLYK
jgi:phage gp29-like protein